MNLTYEENEILEGKLGMPAQKSMEMLVGLGECYDAERMIRVSSAHLLSNRTALGEGGMLFFKEMADRGARFLINASTNPISFDPKIWKQCGIPQQLMDDQDELYAIFSRMGAFMSTTCTPYLSGHAPRLREHVAWNESSAISFANSVLGARSNREGAPSAFAAAITGRVPEYGLHLNRNRLGEVKIVVTAKLKNEHDYGILGYFTGKIAQDRVPVFIGVPQSVSCDELKILGAAAAVSGSVALYHVVGVTPEAPDEAAAFGGSKCNDWQTVEFNEKQLRDTEETLSSPVNSDVDLVALGCPHVSIMELRNIARLLAGRKLRPNVALWVGTSPMVRAYGNVMEYVKSIEASGATVLAGACPMAMVKAMSKDGRLRTIATDSPKLANGVGVYDATEGKVTIYYRTTDSCVELAASPNMGA